MRIFLCEDSIDGIFSGIYDAWGSRLGHENVKLELAEGFAYELFARYQDVPPDQEKAKKVADTLRRRLGQEDYQRICQAALSKEKDKAENIYRTVVAAFLGKRYGSIFGNLQNSAISRVFVLSRTTGNEAYRYIEFLRFRELENGVLFAQIQPENQILSLIGDHFADRFPGEDFLIYDETHAHFLAHRAGKQWVILEGETLNREQIRNLSKQEKEISKLWKGFFHSIAVEERRNQRLQQQFLPLKVRSFMTEMQDSK